MKVLMSSAMCTYKILLFFTPFQLIRGSQNKISMNVLFMRPRHCRVATPLIDGLVQGHMAIRQD